MAWGDATSDAPGQMGQIDPQVLKRLQLYQLLMSQRGTAGMQPSSQMFGGAGGMGAGAAPGYQNLMNNLAGGGQQGGLAGMLLQNPELLKYFMGQNQQGMGNYPQGGGGVDLLQLLGFPSR